MIRMIVYGSNNTHTYKPQDATTSSDALTSKTGDRVIKHLTHVPKLDPFDVRRRHFHAPPCLPGTRVHTLLNSKICYCNSIACTLASTCPEQTNTVFYKLDNSRNACKKFRTGSAPSMTMGLRDVPVTASLIKWNRGF